MYIMKCPTISLTFCLRVLVSSFCLAMAFYQISGSTNKYLAKPTATTMEKGSLHRAAPLMWVCRKPGINLRRLQELGYISLEDLRLGRWMGKGHLDWTANNSLDPAALYAEITRFEGRSLLKGGIIANTEKDGFIAWAKNVSPKFNIDFGECIQLHLRPVVKGRVILRPN